VTGVSCRSAGALSLVLLSVGCSVGERRGQVLPTVSQAIRSPAKSSGQYLYVANALSNGVTIYPNGSSHPLRTIRQGGGYTIAFDSSANLYASNGAPDTGEIKVYAAGTTKRLRTIHNDQPLSLAVDTLGYLYVADGGDGIVVYGPGSVHIFRVIRRGVACTAVALDRADNLYVACEHSVMEYVPGKTPGSPKFVREVAHLYGPHAIAFGPSGNLFVALHGSVNVYKTGSLTLLRTIPDIKAPAAIATDSIGRLYVTSIPFNRQGYQPGWVSVYPVGHAKPVRKITEGIDVPKAVAVDAGDNVYVANTWGNSVSVFGPGGAKRLRTITDGAEGPDFLAFSSQ
jgi:DNA-binding beta-propeller fold protein YncE